METIIKFESKSEFAKYVKEQAAKILNEQKIESLGTPTDLKMNKNDGTKDSTGAKVEAKPTGGFKTKTDAPVNVPKEFKTTKDPVDVKMAERSEGHDEKIATAAKIEGTNSKKGSSETNPYVEGQPKPNVTSKKTQPNVTTEADPTKEGGIPGKKG